MISYDIDQITGASKNEVEIADALRLRLENEPPEDLYIEERVVIDAWIFSYCMGNQLGVMLDHRQFTEIFNGFAALLLLDDVRLHEFVRSMQTVFQRNGIDPSTAEGFFPIAELPDEAYALLSTGIEQAEEPFLSLIWGKALEESFGRYLRLHIDVFRTRNAH